MKLHARKTMAPVVVVLCIISYYAIVGVVVVKSHLFPAIKMTVVIASIIIAMLLFVVLIERIKEISKGEEDDLGEY